MVWTAPATQDFYRKFILRHRQHFSEETVEEVERELQMRQSRLDDFTATT